MERDKKAMDLTNRMESSLETKKLVEEEEEEAPLKVGDDDRKTWRIVRLMRDIFVSMGNKDHKSVGAGCVAPKVNKFVDCFYCFLIQLYKSGFVVVNIAV